MPITPICSICCDHFTRDCVIKATKCGHIFHSQCILRWLTNNPNCPECRRFENSLYRVYFNFNDSSSVEDKTTEAKLFKAEQRIDTLMMKFSLEERKNREAVQRVEALERQLREQRSTAKAIDELYEKMIQTFKEKANMEALENAKRSRKAAEEAEKLLKKELQASKLKKQQQHQTTSSTINIVSRGAAHANSVAKALCTTSSCTNNCLGLRVKNTTVPAKSTLSSLSLLTPSTSSSSLGPILSPSTSSSSSSPPLSIIFSPSSARSTSTRTSTSRRFTNEKFTVRSQNLNIK